MNRRTLPTLIALPIPKIKKMGVSPPRNHFRHPHKSKRDEPTTDLGVHKSAILDATDALSAVIDLTLSFLTEGEDYVRQAESWLTELKNGLDVLEDALQCGYLDNNVTIGTEGVDSLIDVLNCMPEFEDDLNEIADRSAVRMLLFWLIEIKRRGDELYHICIMSVDCCQAENSFKSMKNMGYPVR